MLNNTQTIYKSKLANICKYFMLNTPLEVINKLQIFQPYTIFK